MNLQIYDQYKNLERGDFPTDYQNVEETLQKQRRSFDAENQG